MIDPSTARDDYYVSGMTHGMMSKIMPDGDLEPMSLWFGVEGIACKRMVSLAKQHRTPACIPDNEERVANSVLAINGRDILTFYNRNFTLSKLVYANHEFLEDGTPDMPWQIQKLLILEAEALMRRDLNCAVCLNGLASRNNAPVAPAAPTANKPTNKSTTRKKKGLCRTSKSTGKCRFGDTCRFGHAASADALAADALALPVAAAMQDPEEDQMGIDLEEFTCGANLGPGCFKTCKMCPSFWVELGKKHQKAFATPIACKLMASGWCRL